MESKFRVFSLSIAVVLLLTGCALADIINPRPIYNGAADTTLDSLQGVFDGIDSTIDVKLEQNGAAVFNNQSTGANSTYVASLSWNAAGFPFEFGIYDFNNTATLVAIFQDGTDGIGTSNVDPGDYSTINFDSVANSVYTEYHDAGVVGSTVISKSAYYFDSFGFYFSWFDTLNHIYYSEDSLNNGIPATLAFIGNGDIVDIAGQTGGDANHWYIAMEGYGGTTDFNDIVVQMESIQPVIPEPTTLLLIGSGLGLLGLVVRRRKR